MDAPMLLYRMPRKKSEWPEGSFDETPVAHRYPECKPTIGAPVKIVRPEGDKFVVVETCVGRTEKQVVCGEYSTEQEAERAARMIDEGKIPCPRCQCMAYPVEITSFNSHVMCTACADDLTKRAEVENTIDVEDE